MMSMWKMGVRLNLINPFKFYNHYKCKAWLLYHSQGRSQPHSPWWASVPLSSYFPQILINFSYFSSNFTYFLPYFGPPGGPTRKGPGYATDHSYGITAMRGFEIKHKKSMLSTQKNLTLYFLMVSANPSILLLPTWAYNIASASSSQVFKFCKSFLNCCHCW